MFPTHSCKLLEGFFMNCGCKDAKKLPVPAKLALLKRAVFPVLKFRWTRWPFRISYAEQLDNVQRQMLGIISGVTPSCDETVEQYIRRRAGESRRLQRQMGSWSDGWAQAICNWDAHLGRPQNCLTWAEMLRHVMSPGDLAWRRVHNFNRPATRSQSGFIQRRWFESVPIAASWLQNTA